MAGTMAIAANHQIPAKVARHCDTSRCTRGALLGQLPLTECGDAQLLAEDDQLDRPAGPASSPARSRRRSPSSGMRAELKSATELDSLPAGHGERHQDEQHEQHARPGQELRGHRLCRRAAPACRWPPHTAARSARQVIAPASVGCERAAGPGGGTGRSNCPGCRRGSRRCRRCGRPAPGPRAP